MVNNMSPVTSFLEEHLLGMMESALAAHEPEFQADFLAEMKVLAQKAHDWIDGKLSDVHKSV